MRGKYQKIRKVSQRTVQTVNEENRAKTTSIKYPLNDNVPFIRLKVYNYQPPNQLLPLNVLALSNLGRNANGLPNIIPNVSPTPSCLDRMAQKKMHPSHLNAFLSNQLLTLDVLDLRNLDRNTDSLPDVTPVLPSVA